jgi:hypothetical protein
MYKDSQGYLIILCVTLPIQEFYWALGVAVLLWCGPNVLVRAWDIYVRLFVIRPYHRETLGASADRSETRLLDHWARIFF